MHDDREAKGQTTRKIVRHRVSEVDRRTEKKCFKKFLRREKKSSEIFDFLLNSLELAIYNYHAREIENTFYKGMTERENREALR